jgi:hypothetical protein
MTCEGIKTLLMVVQTSGFILTGVLSALVAALAWLTKQGVSGAVWIYRRRQREREIVLALRAEIMSNLSFEEVYADPDVIGKIVATMKRHKAWSDSFMPYVAVDPRDLVMDKVSNELTVLPATLLPSIVKYYNLSGALAVQLSDLRSDAFKSIGIDRQIGVFEDIKPAAIESCDAGQAALRLIDGYLVKPSRGAIITSTIVLSAAIVAVHMLQEAYEHINSLISAAAISASTCDLSSVLVPIK